MFSSLLTIKGLRVLKEVLYVDHEISQMGPQIVVRDLQCGGLDWRPALRNQKNIYTL